MAEYKAFDPQQDPKTGAWWYYDPSQAGSQTQGWAQIPTAPGAKLSKEDADKAMGYLRQVEATKIGAANPSPGLRTEAITPQAQAAATAKPAAPAAPAAPAVPKPAASAASRSLGEVVADVPSDIKAAVKKHISDQLRAAGFNLTGGLIDLITPGSWPELAALATTMIPGYGQLGLLAKIAAPMATGAGAGALTGAARGQPVEGALGGAGTGALTGVGARTGEMVAQGLSGAGKRIWEITPQLFETFNQKFAKPLGKAITDSIPLLRQSGVKLNSAMDMRKLFEYNTARKVGETAFDQVEKDIKVKLANTTLEMPVSETIRTTSSAARGTRTGKTTTVGTSASEGVRSGIEAEVPAEHAAKLATRAKIGEEGLPAEPHARASVAEGTRAGTSKVTGESTAQRFGQATTASMRGEGTMNMTIDQAVAHVKQLRHLKDKSGTPETKQLYADAVDALETAVKNVDQKLYKQYKVAKQGYSKYMRFKDTFEGKVGSILPEGNLNIIEFGKHLHENPNLGEQEFGPLFKFFQGGGKRGAYPTATKITPIGGYAHPPGSKFSFFLGRRGTYPGIDLSRTPELARALQKFPEIAKLLEQSAGPQAIGGRAAQMLFEE